LSLSAARPGVLHVVGGGLAGLSAAVEAAAAGRRVCVYEAGPAFGGRARSFLDRQLGCRIDNGNHLLLSANGATLEFLRRIGSEDTLVGPEAPVFPFCEPAAGLHWTLRLSRGRVPWWLLSARRRVPGMRLGELASLGRLLRAGPDTVVSACLADGALARRLLVPLAVSILNTQPGEGSAALLAAVMRDTLAKGGAACLPLVPEEGLSETFADPAVGMLAGSGAELRTATRLQGVVTEGRRVVGLSLPDGVRTVGPSDQLVLAVPAPVAAELLREAWPALVVPDAFESIVNVHYRVELADRLTGAVARCRFIGLVGTLAEWIFVKREVVSVTISAANHLAELPADALVHTAWGEIRAALSPHLRRGTALPAEPPPVRVLREKRATFAATPRQERRRPACRTPIENLFLAGDWTATGLPSTIEGAIRSGSVAARLAESA